MVFTSFAKIFRPGGKMAPQNHQYSYRNIDDSSIWAAKSIYLVKSTILLKMNGIYGNLMKLQKRGGIAQFLCFHTISGGFDLQIPM